ncbi:Tspear, partial [Symbiodinium necroappetens]
IDGKHYLAVANFYNDASHNIDSKIYQWDGSSFAEFQSLATHGAVDWESFVIDGTHYLVVANRNNDASHNIDSKIYKWDGSLFAEFQSLATHGAFDWESFVIDGTHYLVVANHYNDASSNIDSKIYQWDGSSFAEFQSLATHGAVDWESFVIDGTHYLVVANHYNDASSNIDSKIYKWDGSSFAEFQSLATHGAHGWESFVIDGTQYLAVENAFNDASRNIDSKIYRWDGSSFAEFQSLATHGAHGWESFVIDGMHYLAVANYYNDASHNIDSKIYQWDGSSFAEFQSLATHGAHGWESFVIDGTHYLVVANYFDDRFSSWSISGQRLASQLSRPKFLGVPTRIRLIRRSTYVLALNMILESGLLYVTEAYQRSALIGFSNDCGSGILQPVLAENCPSETATLELPECQSGLGQGELCEADFEAAGANCPFKTELDNCGKFDIYTMETPRCTDIGCFPLATGLWFFSLLSLGLTIAWTAAFYTRAMQNRLVLQKQLWRWRACVFMTALGILMFIIYMIGFVGGSISVLAQAVLNPLLVLAAWVMALAVVFTPGAAKEANVSKAAAMELPFFNALLAMYLTGDEVEELQKMREPLSTGLRLVEDIPELVIGGLDLFYFGGDAWYAWLGIGCSFTMILFHLFVGILLTCRQSAMSVARRGRQPDTE